MASELPHKEPGLLRRVRVPLPLHIMIFNKNFDDKTDITYKEN
jgi:hypothetical protein